MIDDPTSALRDENKRDVSHLGGAQSQEDMKSIMDIALIACHP